MPKVRTYDAQIVYTGDDCTLHFPQERYVYGNLKESFKDGERVIVTIQPRKKKRSLSQNSYLHMLLQMIADETGNSLEVIKTTIKAMYAKKELTDKHGDPLIDENTGEAAYYIQETSDMSVEEMMLLTENVKEFARDFLGMVLPEPSEQLPLKIK